MASILKRRNQDGTEVWRVRIRRKGLKPIEATFPRKTDAVRWAQKIESEVHEEKFFEQAEARKHTLGEAIDRYIKEELPKKPKVEDLHKTRLEWWKQKIGHKLLSSVTTVTISDAKSQLVSEVKNHKGKKLSGSTINRYLSTLSCVLTTAKRRWHWIERNPVQDVDREREPKGRVRFLTTEERNRLLDACRSSDCPSLLLVVVLALSTGMRKNEIRHLRWTNLDLKTGTILLYETKNKEPRRVAVRGFALDLLHAHAKLRRLDTDLLFPGNIAGKKGAPFDFRKAWEAARKKAGLSNFVFHDLRHSCASYLAMGGASPIEIAEVLGHKSLDMVKRYSHLSESHTASVVERMNKQLFGQ